MLYALSIQSFVLIDELQLEAADGFTALTGETGAGKSIILDAINLVLGGSADRAQIRSGADQAGITAEFLLSPTHPAWDVLRDQDIAFDSNECLVLRRTLSRSGPSRAFINGQPVAAGMLAQLGERLVEIHGQHAASRLMRPATHLDLLDAYGGLEAQVSDCQRLWQSLMQARAAQLDLEERTRGAKERQDWLIFAVEELEKLAPEPEEIEGLTAQRSLLLQSERITEAIEYTAAAVREPQLDTTLTQAAKSIDRIVRIPELETHAPDLAGRASATADALERTLIELSEVQHAVQDLTAYAAHDSERLETVESRLFALRAAARKYDCLPELLGDTLTRYQSELALCADESNALEAAVAAEAAATKAWRACGEDLREQRRACAAQLEQAIQDELVPLHLGRVRVRVAFKDIAEDESGAKGLERAEFEVETNPGAGFGPLKAIASGGELARFSLALKCALSQVGDACTLVFDEADQGVGGAVAAAIGERLAVLAQDRQVFAITHSPQVASAATRQWRVLKDQDDYQHVVSRVAQLDDGQRLEEIARMLSGSSITNEARAAALKLLEAA